jgi:hypothetical protein
MMRRIEACIGSHGEHFEHLLQMYSFSYNSQIKYFRTHVDTGIFLLFWYVELVPEMCPYLSVTPDRWGPTFYNAFVYK